MWLLARPLVCRERGRIALQELPVVCPAKLRISPYTKGKHARSSVVWHHLGPPDLNWVGDAARGSIVELRRFHDVALNPLLDKAPVNPLDDVIALAQRAKG
jgi:hypothetical protein